MTKPGLTHCAVSLPRLDPPGAVLLLYGRFRASSRPRSAQERHGEAAAAVSTQQFSVEASAGAVISRTISSTVTRNGVSESILVRVRSVGPTTPVDLFRSSRALR